MTRQLTSAGLALVALAVASPRVLANGAFPDEFSVHFPAPAPHRILLGANFGLIVSEDDGATWRYSCEPWITQGSDAALSGASVDFYQTCADGAVLAQSLHVTRSSDVGCTWPQSGGSVAAPNVFVRDLFPDPTDTSFVLAILLDDHSNSLLVASHNGGITFDAAPLYKTAAILSGIEISRMPPSVIYATSYATNGSNATLLRSTDRGANWTPYPIPAPSGTQPRIMQVDPVDSSVVYLRLVGGQTDSILIARNGGQSFDPAFTINGQFSAFLRATDGTLYAGTQAGVLYTRAPGATSAFTNAPGPHLRCLGQRPGASRIYACGDFFLDGFSLGTSDDGGKTFARVMNFTDILGPLTCAPVTTNCAAHWARIQSVLGIGDGGTGTLADAGSAVDAGVTTGPDAGAVSTPPPGGATKGGCSTVAAGGAALICLLALLSRKRKS